MILTITGSDGTGGSGIQADIRFITQLGGQVVSVVTSITAQNTLGIQQFYDLPASVVRLQLEAIINDLQPQVVKIGLLRRCDVVETVASVLRRHHPQHVIYAPVLTSIRGDQMVPPEVYHTIREQLLPLCDIILDPTDISAVPKQHGLANQLSSAISYFLSKGENTDDAIMHAKSYLQQLPAGYVENNSRSAELYNRFLYSVNQYHRSYNDVAFYAEQLNVSPRYLGQVTKRFGDRSPKAIIDKRIINDIAVLLTTTHKSLKEIAFEMGFSSQSQLSRFFKKQTGLSPSQHKNKNH